MSVLKMNKKKLWNTLYGGGIHNRLHKDKDLSDVKDINKSKHNLELIGEVEDHWHDNRYYTRESVNKKLSDFYNSTMDTLNKFIHDTFEKFKNSILAEIGKLMDNIIKNRARIKALRKRKQLIEAKLNAIFDSQGRLVYPNKNLLWIEPQQKAEAAAYTIYWENSGEATHATHSSNDYYYNNRDDNGITTTTTYTNEKTITIPTGVSFINVKSGVTGFSNQAKLSAGTVLKFKSSIIYVMKWQYGGPPGPGVPYPASYTYRLEIIGHGDLADEKVYTFDVGNYGGRMYEVADKMNKGLADGTIPDPKPSLTISWF